MKRVMRNLSEDAEHAAHEYATNQDLMSFSDLMPALATEAIRIQAVGRRRGIVLASVFWICVWAIFEWWR